MQNTILCQYLVRSNLLNIYRCWGDEELDGISAHGSKIASQQSKFAILFGDFDYLASDNSTLAINYEKDMPSAFHFDSRESAIAAWEQFKARNNFQRYQELIDVAIALNLDTEPHEFDSVEYAGCLEEGSLIQLPEPTVFALYFRNGELEVLNYSLMVFLKKENCTEADLDQAIAYFSNLQ